MTLSLAKTPPPVNEPVLSYGPGTPERAELKATLDAQMGETIEVPMVIGGEKVTTGKTASMNPPHQHAHELGRYHVGGVAEVEAAIQAAAKAKPGWSDLHWEVRAAIFLKAADLLAGPYRQVLNSATMLGQGKNAFQAEIDAACELIDFLRFNVAFAREILTEQPENSPGVWNRVEYRPLDGFVLAVTPFNFTAIAGNLPTAAALMGNTVVWKPSDKAMFSAHYFMQILERCGLPPGVINLVQGDAATMVGAALESPDFSGLHYTGSAQVFEGLWSKIGQNMARYKSFPRIVGEAGGKDFVFVHPSADLDEVATGLVRGSFEYQGQKCSAASRAYIPRSKWPAIRAKLEAQMSEIRVGPPTDFSNFVNAVISKDSFDRLAGAISAAKEANGAEVTLGGGCDDSVGYFVDPTVILVDDPKYDTMQRELFGPVLTVFLYDEKDLEATLELVDTTSPFALTGAIFARDRSVIHQLSHALRFAAGNFYINDKPTGAVVGQQPFGGSMKSGTNDKAGSKLNLYRWVSPRSIKETFVPPTHFGYPFHQEG